MKSYRNPFPTVDVIVRQGVGIILIRRKNPPYGWALPGGFVEYGESLEDAAVREVREETGLDIRIERQLHTYSDPGRDERFHTITTVYVASGEGQCAAGDDAADVAVFRPGNLPEPICFDHRAILNDYFTGRY